MKVCIFGATGMIGAGVLIECIDAPDVQSILVIGRNSCGVSHPKLREVLLPDISKIHDVRDMLATQDACFFCLGVSSVGMNEADYNRLTHDLTLTVAREMFAVAPNATFIYVSGASTDSSEKGKSMWARVKGKTENDLLRIGFRAAYMFRPGFIQPVRGVKSRTNWYQIFYTLLNPVAALLVRYSPRIATTTSVLGRAMIMVARRGHPTAILESIDINKAATA